MKMVDDKRLRRIIRRYKKNSGELDAELEIPLTLSQIYKAIGIRKRDPCLFGHIDKDPNSFT
jgi:hypothetical protein